MKDALGHGSNGRAGASPSLAGRTNPKIRAAMAAAKVRDEADEAHREHVDAAQALASGPKSAAVPVHDGAAGRSDEYDEYNRDLRLRLLNGQVGSGMKFRG